MSPFKSKYLPIVGLIIGVAVIATFVHSTLAVRNPAPLIQSITPISGPINGGTEVTITGQYFTGTTSVTFGGSTATVLSGTDTSLTVSTTAHTEGVVDVTISTPDGTSTLPASYSYKSIPTSTLNCKDKKVLVCHIPNGNPANAHNICVGKPAGPVHLDNDDYLGACK